MSLPVQLTCVNWAVLFELGKGKFYSEVESSLPVPYEITTAIISLKRSNRIYWEEFY